jgi:aryl-alcohol dehydrogenase-like predicted oxidoreductase
MGLGGHYERDTHHDSDAIAILCQAVDYGIRLFDTAEVYGEGHSEEILGQAISGRRDKAIVATKFSPENSGKEQLIKACEQSLRRLGTDYIDVYQTHWPNPAIPLEETVAGLSSVVKSGKVRAIAFGNSSVSIIEKAINLLPEGFPVVAMQQEYSLIERFAEIECLPYCATSGIGFFAYSPLAQGRLNADNYPELDLIAKENEVTVPQLVLQWVLFKTNVIAIPMTSNANHLKSNFESFSQTIPSEVFELLSDMFKTTIEELPTESMFVLESHDGKYYRTLDEARQNPLSLSPGPLDIAGELADGAMLKPIKVEKDLSSDRYAVVEGQLRYWGWRLAYEDKKPILCQVIEK